MDALLPKEEFIADKIHIVRDQKVILDSDLAELYGVETKALKQQVRRNIERFPDDFMFELTKDEYLILRSQNVTSSSGWGGVRYMPIIKIYEIIKGLIEPRYKNRKPIGYRVQERYAEYFSKHKRNN